MIVATIMFPLETKKLAEEWSKEEAQENNLNSSLLSKGKEYSNNKEDGLGAVWLCKW